jgi:hypothetical protein
MSVQAVLLPVFVQVGLIFLIALLMLKERVAALTSRKTHYRDIALGEPNWPPRAIQAANCFRNQFEMPVLFFVLIAIALPLRRADLVVVLLSWVFVVTRFAHAGIFVTSNNVRQRGLAFIAGVLVLMAMWLYVAVRLLIVL